MITKIYLDQHPGQTLVTERAPLAHGQVVKINYIIRRGPMDHFTERAGTTSPALHLAQ